MLVIATSPLHSLLKRYLIPKVYIFIKDKSFHHIGSLLKYLVILNQTWYEYDSQNNTGQQV